MKIEDSTPKGGFGVLIEGPAWGNIEFYANWLQAAAKAEAFWKTAYNEPDYLKQVDRLSVIAIPDFGLAATELLMRLKDHFLSFVISSNEEVVDEFVMMVEMGFFVRSGKSYQMAVPTELSLARVKAAALNYAKTEDDNYYLHPELIVSMVPLDEALQCQARYLAISDFRRDRRAAPNHQSLS